MADQQTATQEFSLPILPLIKDKQNNNGLKNGNYLRYRTYCTKKLRKLREKLQITHRETRGKKQAPFFKREITTVKDFFQVNDPAVSVATAVDSRRAVHLLSLVVFQSERAWSFAMQLKQELAEKPDSQKRHHYLQRMSKACKWSVKLEELAKECFDKRSQLEAEAYHSWMQANLLLAKEKWREAQDSFIHSRTIYDHLSTVGRVAQKEIYRQRVEEVDPSIRFCLYNMGEKKSAASADMLSLIDSSDNHGLDLLKAKLEEVLEETRRNQAKTMEEVEWNGTRILIENEKVRVMLINVEATRAEIDTCNNGEGKVRLYDKLFITLSDCQKLVRDDLKGNSKKDDPKFVSNMRMLHSYLSYIQLLRTIDRNLILIANAVQKLEEDANNRKVQSRDKKRLTTPLDLVRLYEVVIQNVSELLELDGIESQVQLKNELQCHQHMYKAIRCLYLGKEYAGNEQWKEAIALYEQCELLSRNVAKSMTSSNTSNNKSVSSILALPIPPYKHEEYIKQVKQAKCVAKAQYILSKAAKQSDDDSVFESSSSSTSANASSSSSAAANAQQQQQQDDVLHRLDSFTIDRRGKPFLVAFPPNYEHVPAKPIYFDVANNNIKQPDLSAKLAKKGWFSFWR